MVLRQVHKADYATEHRPAWTAVISFAVAEDTTRRNRPSGKDANANFTGVASLNAKPV